MATILPTIVLVLGLLGSATLWISFLNRSHGLGVWRPIINACSLLALCGLVLGPIAVTLGIVATWPVTFGALDRWLNSLALVARARQALPTTVLTAYALTSAAVAVLAIVVWASRRLTLHRPVQLLRNHSAEWNIADRDRLLRFTRGIGRLAARLPGNEIFRLEVNEKVLALPGLPARLEGLTIAHLTDFHFSGRITREFFQALVERTNELAPDLVAITGDIVDTAPCIDWIPDTLGRLIAPCGAYYVLGNHDCRVDLARLRDTLDRSGLIDLGGRRRQIEIAGETITLAGNELPWIKPAADRTTCDNASDQRHALRILLSHSPDQVHWARRRGFDLMLAGHTHGGQIQFPLLGPLLVPSLFSTRYAAGTFYQAPTLMHVSRGVSALTPVRYLCRPEIALLRLTRAATPDAGDAQQRGDLAASAS